MGHEYTDYSYNVNNQRGLSFIAPSKTLYATVIPSDVS